MDAQDQLHLPVLLRTSALRNKFPFCSHLGLTAQAYDNRVAWAKMSGFAPWPSRIATAEEMKQLPAGKPPSTLAPNQTLQVSSTTGEGAANNEGEAVNEDEATSDLLCMYFFGSQQVGLVKRGSLELDYCARYGENSLKSASRTFLMGLEEADGFVLRECFKEGCGSCMVCGGKDSPNRIILCDRCNSEVHLDCLQPSLNSVPEGTWFCPICVVEAPLTYQQESKREAALSPANGSAQKQQSASRRRAAEQDSASRKRPHVATAAAAATSAAANASLAGSKWSVEEDAVLWHGVMNHDSFQDISNKMEHRSYSGCVHRHRELLRKSYQPPANLLQLVQRHKQKQDLKRSSAAAAPAQTPTSHGSQRSRAAAAAAAAAAATTTTTTTAEGESENAAFITSQISELLRVAQMPEMHRETPAPCFVCKREGPELIECADPICGKRFHAFCLGSCAPQEAEEAWYCPWHSCALCPRDPPTSVALFSKKAAKNHHTKLAAASFEGTCTPRARRRRREEAEASEGDKQDAHAEEEEQQLVGDGQQAENGQVDHAIKFARCIACPLALCDKHLQAPCADGTQYRREPHANSHFFLCERCEQQPISLAKALDQILSTAVVQPKYAHTLVLRPGVRMIQACAAPETARTLLRGEEDRPLSCGELQRLVRKRKFSTLAEFERAVAEMCNMLHTMYKWKHPKLAASCRAFQVELSQLLRAHSVELAALERRAVQQQQQQQQAGAEVLRGITPWENYVRWSALEVADDSMAAVVDPSTTFAHLFQALQAARLVQPLPEDTATTLLQTPTESEIEAMFETHSASLRASLTSAARVRTEVAKVFASLKASQETIQALEAELAETKSALEQERSKAGG